MYKEKFRRQKKWTTSNKKNEKETYIVLAHDFEFSRQAVGGQMFTQQRPAFF